MSMKLRFAGQTLSWSRSAGLGLLLIVAAGVTARAQQSSASAFSHVSAPLLVGYVPAFKGDDLTSTIKSLDLTRMTHLDLAFGNPPKCDGACTARSDMSFSLKGQSDAGIDEAVRIAHKAGVKVLLSIGGGGGDQRIIQFYNVGLSAPLIVSLDDFIRKHDLDGVDLDIEDPGNMGAPFAQFVSLLISTFHPEGKLVTGAVAKYLQASMPGSALHQFDFINVMNYSSYASALAALQFYTKDENIPKDKIVLGVPFFGTNAGDTKEEDYSTILAAYPNAWKVDMAGGGALDDGQAFSYLGEETMAEETQLARQYGGVMIWEVMGDAPSPHSLLRIIEKNLDSPSAPARTCPCGETAQANTR